MKLKVIDGGRQSVSVPQVSAVPCVPSREAVLQEAERRLQAAGYEKWRNREMVTGVPMPREISYLEMQIRFVAEVIVSLSTIPEDFWSDIYWPA